MGYPRYQRARAFKFTRRSTGNVTLTTTPAAVDTAMDIALEAQAGDVLLMTLGGFMDDSANAFAMFDVVTMNGSTPIKFLSNDANASPLSGMGNGFSAWFTSSGVQYNNIAGSVMGSLAAGDVVNGLVTLRVIAKAAGTRTLRAGTGDPFFFSAQNLGPADTN